MKLEPKIDSIPLATPNFGAIARPAVLTVKWLSRSAKVNWSLGIGERHPQYFTFVAFLDPGWTEQLASRLNREGYRWTKGRVINIEKMDLGVISTCTSEWILESLPPVFAKATELYNLKHVSAAVNIEGDPVTITPRPKIQVEAGSD